MKFLILAKTFFLLIVAYLVSVLTRRPTNKNYLIGSDYGDSEDLNSQMVFQSLKHTEQRVLWVKNKPVNDSELVRGSFKSTLAFFQARAVFFSHSLSDILPHAHHLGWFLRFLPTPKKVFLQHGVVGLKLDSSFNGYLKSQLSTVDKMVVSTNVELQILLELGVEKHKLIEVALPRLAAYPEPDQLVLPVKELKVLVFLTWSSTEQYRNNIDQITQVMQDLQQEGGGYTLMVRHHPMMVRQDSEYKKNRLVEDSILKADVLITDNSSVAWDFFFLKKPVIFYRPSPVFHHSLSVLVRERTANNYAELKLRLLECRIGACVPPQIDWFYENNYKPANMIVETVSSANH